MTHKGRCFRDRRKTKKRKMKQLHVLIKSAVERIMPSFSKALTEVHIPEVAEIPLPEPRKETPLPKEFVKPEKEASLKRRSW